MSAILCHYLHGKRVLQSHMEQIADRDAFLLGTQGPAVFAYSLLFGKEHSREAQTFCHQICSTPIEILLTFCEENRNSEDTMFSSYCLGVLCYGLLEQGMAPFVSYGAEMIHRLEPSGTMEDYKNQIESALDIILLRYETGQLPTEVNLKTTVPVSDAICNASSQFYQLFAEKYCNCQTNEKMIASLLLDGIKGIGKLNDRSMLKRQFIKRREKRHKQSGGFSSLIRNISEDTDYDYANVCQNEWQWPLETGTIRTETFFDLFENAASKTKQMLSAL